MFNKIDDIRKAMYEFKLSKRVYPNVIFISRNKRQAFIQMAYNSWEMDVYSPVHDYFGDIKICGTKVVWTENTDGVDYLPQLQPLIMEEFSAKTKDELLKLFDSDTTRQCFGKKNIPLIEVKEKSRRIIL